MTRSPLILAVLLLGGCASAPSQPAQPREPISWQAGRYQLEGSVTTESGGMPQQEMHNADLLIDSHGELSLQSSSGVCQDPEPAAMGADAARGRRTFICGPVRYEMQPAGTTVRGRLFAPVIKETRTTVCVRYATNAQGQQVCVESQEKIDRTEVIVSTQLLVRPRP